MNLTPLILKGDETIALMEFHRIGDALMALPTLSAVKKRYPDCTTIAVLDPIAASIARNHPDIDQIVLLNKKDPIFTNIFKLLKLRKQGVDVTMDTLGMSKTAIASWLTGAKIRIGMQKKRARFYTHLIDTIGFDDYYSVLWRMHLTKAIDAFPDPLIYPKIYLDDKEREMFASTHEYVKEPFISSAPGSKIEYAAFSPLDWAQLYNVLLTTTTIPFYLYGSPDEMPFLEEVYANITQKERSFLITLKNADEIALLISFAYAHFCRDNGTKHIANALEIPSYTIFPGTNNPPCWISTNEAIIDDHYNLQDFDNNNGEKIKQITDHFIEFLHKIKD